MPSFRTGTILLAALAAIASPVHAQEPETRADALRQQRAEKAESLVPYESNAVEDGLNFVQNRAIFLLNREGLYPKLGSLTTGSGFAYGAGWRNSRLLDHNAAVDVWVAASIKRYFAWEVRGALPRLAGGHAFAEGYYRRRDYPSEDFFGIGPSSLRANHTSYAVRGNIFGGRAGIRPMRRLRVGGTVELLQPRVGTGDDNAVPSIEELFTEETAPGLTRQPDFLRTGAFVEYDYREPRYPRGGGYYLAEFSRNADRDFDAYSFNRFDVDLRQFIGFLAGRRVIALRAFASTSDADDGQTVPFYSMPALGGNDTLRGFRDYRFRGPHAILLQGEYRWELWSGLDAALFYDTGKVTERRRDLDFSDLERAYGFGFRFNTNEGIILRVDAGFGSRDGNHLYIVFGGIF